MSADTIRLCIFRVASGRYEWWITVPRDKIERVDWKAGEASTRVVGMDCNGDIWAWIGEPDAQCRNSVTILEVG